MSLQDESRMGLASSLKETFSNSELVKTGADIAEASFDSVLKEGFLKEIPVIGSLVGLWKTGLSVRDHFFLKKLLLFLQESSELPAKKRERLIERLEDEEYQEDAGEKLIAIIDNLETSSKAKILGKVIALFANEIISTGEFWRISFVIDKLPLSDILALKNWKEQNLNEVETIRRHLYLTVGVAWFVLDTSSTGFQWEERLCEIFAVHLIELQPTKGG